MKEIPLLHGYIAIIDDEDYERVSRYTWTPLIDKSPRLSTVYARTSIQTRSRKEARETGLPRKKTILLHRFILGVDDPRIHVDHKNGNGLDNRRENIRVATVSQNRQNSRPWASKRYKGVTRNCNKFQASIRANGDNVFIGNFETEEDAALAYDSLARLHFGEFARCNFT